MASPVLDESTPFDDEEGASREEDIASLRWEIEEKNRELEQLAQIGQSLLQGKQYAEELAERYRIEGEREIEAVHSKLEAALLELQSSQQQIEHLTERLQKKKNKKTSNNDGIDTKAILVVSLSF